MHNSLRLEQLRQHPQSASLYRGSLTASDWGEEARLGAAWPSAQVLLYDTSWRASIGVAGADARKWLNGMITANLRDLEIGSVVPSFQLDPKGHVLASFAVACTGDQSFRLLVDEEQRAGLLERLKKFVFISKVALEDEGERYSSLLVRGPEWPEAWREAGLPRIEAAERRLQPLPTEGRGDGDAWAIAGSRGGIAELEVWATADVLRNVWERLGPRCAIAGSETFERDRILSGVPRYGLDITESELPQETGQFDCLDFTKGCYVGQEIVERIRARGAVHRHLVRVSLAAEAAPGAELSVAGKPAGKLTSLTRQNGAWQGLGYVREPHHAPGTEMQAAAGERGVLVRVEALVEARAQAAIVENIQP